MPSKRILPARLNRRSCYLHTSVFKQLSVQQISSLPTVQELREDALTHALESSTRIRSWKQPQPNGEMRWDETHHWPRISRKCSSDTHRLTHRTTHLIHGTLHIATSTVRDGICVDRPLCRGTSQCIFGSRILRLVCKGDTVGKIRGWNGWERTCACGQWEWDITRGWQLLWGHKDVQSLSLSHACSRDEMWSCCATLYVLYLWVCCSHLPSVGWRFFSRQPKPVLTLGKITNRQGLKNAENSNCSSSTGFGPTLTTMTKLFASWPEILTKLSAGFSATLCRTSNLFSGLPRSRILRFLRTVVLFLVELVDCEGMVLQSCWVLARCSSCNRLYSLFSCLGGWCWRTCKLSAGNLSREPEWHDAEWRNPYITVRHVSNEGPACFLLARPDAQLPTRNDHPCCRALGVFLARPSDPGHALCPRHAESAHAGPCLRARTWFFECFYCAFKIVASWRMSQYLQHYQCKTVCALGATSDTQTSVKKASPSEKLTNQEDTSKTPERRRATFRVQGNATRFLAGRRVTPLHVPPRTRAPHPSTPPLCSRCRPLCRRSALAPASPASWRFTSSSTPPQATSCHTPLPRWWSRRRDYSDVLLPVGERACRGTYRHEPRFLHVFVSSFFQRLAAVRSPKSVKRSFVSRTNASSCALAPNRRTAHLWSADCRRAGQQERLQHGWCRRVQPLHTIHPRLWPGVLRHQLPKVRACAPPHVYVYVCGSPVACSCACSLTLRKCVCVSFYAWKDVAAVALARPAPPHQNPTSTCRKGYTCTPTLRAKSGEPRPKAPLISAINVLLALSFRDFQLWKSGKNSEEAD